MTDMKKKIISLCIPEDIWKKARKKCIDEGISFSKYVTILLIREIGGDDGEKHYEDG